MSATTLSTGTISLSSLRGPCFDNNASVSLSQCIRRNWQQYEADSSDARIAGTSLPWRAGEGNNNNIPATSTGYTVGKVSISMSHLRGAVTWMQSVTNDRYFYQKGIGPYAYTDSGKNTFYYYKLWVQWANVSTIVNNTGVLVQSNQGLTSYTIGSYTYYGGVYLGFNFGSGFGGWLHVIARTYNP